VLAQVRPRVPLLGRDRLAREKVVQAIAPSKESSKTPRGERRQLHCFLFGKILIASGVAVRSRAASPTKRGQNCIASQAIIEKSGTHAARLLVGSRTIGRLRCSIARGTRSAIFRAPLAFVWGGSRSARPRLLPARRIDRLDAKQSASVTEPPSFGASRHHDLAQGLSYSSWRRHQ
jgi:hypothetical protein